MSGIYLPCCQLSTSTGGGLEQKEEMRHLSSSTPSSQYTSLSCENLKIPFPLLLLSSLNKQEDFSVVCPPHYLTALPQSSVCTAEKSICHYMTETRLGNLLS